MSLPKSLFISHGAPDLVLANTQATQFLKDYGADLPKPDGIVMVSAHFETQVPTVVSDPAPEMIYDFRGFDPKLQTLVYPAQGSPQLAARVADCLSQAGIDHETRDKRGFDHGAWVPMMLMRPQADIPVVQLSVQPQQDASWHMALGKALAPLTQANILIIGSGSLTHNLAAMFQGGIPARDADVPDWVAAFADWIHTTIQAEDWDRLSDYRRQAPHAVENHPEEEHLHPLFVAAGVAAAIANKGRATRVHASSEFGVLAMDAYAFS